MGAIRRHLTALILIAGLCVVHDGPAAAQVSESINIVSQPVGFNRDEPGRTHFGKLEWLGTLKLDFPSQAFGGYSGLAIDAAGKQLLAVSDEGTWLKADLVYRDGKIEKVDNARIGPLHSTRGKVLDKKSLQDAEGMTLASPGSFTGDVYISFERRHRIAVHKLTPRGIGRARRLLTLPKALRSAKGNKGLEGLTLVTAGPSKGSLLAMTEEHLDASGNHIGWLIGGPKPGMLSLRKRDGFSVTDLASLPGGDVFVLERRFRFSEGVKMRIRRLRAKDIKPGALFDGEILFRANQLFEIDNMEGIAAHRDATGRTILTVISDDNFNRILQRTLLMQFAVVE